MRIAIIFISLLVSIQSFGQAQSTLPAGAFPLSSQSYRSPNGDVWIGRDGMYYNVGSKAKTDSVFALFKVRDLSQGANIVINKTNPNNWIISSTGGGTGSADWGQIGGDIGDQSDLLDSLNSKLSLAVFDPVYNTLSGDQLLRYNAVTGKWENFSPSWILPGSNISLLNNNVGYAVTGSGADQVRNNNDLDGRYAQFSDIPNVPSHVMNISVGDITNWNNKLNNITAGTNVSIDKTNPLNPVINVTVPPSGITGMLGDVTSAGTGNVVTTISNEAVTTAKIQANAVTFDKMQTITKGRLLGVGGGGSNTWSEAVPNIGTTFPGEWNAGSSYSSGVYRWYGTVLYVSNGTPTTGTPPPSEPARWAVVKTEFYGYYNNSTTYAPGSTIYFNSTSRYYTTSATTTGIAPNYTPPVEPGVITEITLGSNLSLGEDNVLNATSNASSITGLVQAGTNMTRTGNGTTASPYVFNATGGGGGASSLSSLSDTDIVGPGVNQVLTWSGATWQNKNLPTATVFSRSANGLVPAPGGSSSNRVLHEDGLWKVPAGGGGGITAISQASDVQIGTPIIDQVLSWDGSKWINKTFSGGGGGGISQLTGDVLASGSGSVSATIANGAVSNNKMANMAGQTIKGRFGSAGAPEDLHNFAVRRIINPVFAISGTTINVQNGSKQYATRSANTTYTMQEFYAGLELQVEISNSSGGAITITFDGATFPDGVNGSIPAGKTAVFSMTKFNTMIRATKVIF